MRDIVDNIEYISNFIQSRIEEDKFTIAYKTSDDPESSDFGAPVVFPFVLPQSAMKEGLPAVTPCIIIYPSDITDYNTFNVNIAIAVCYPSIETEQAVKSDVDGVYNIETVKDIYGVNAEKELYKSAIYLVEKIQKYIAEMSAVIDIQKETINITGLDASLPDYPYCFSEISFTLKHNHTNISVNPYDRYY